MKKAKQGPGLALAGYLAAEKRPEVPKTIPPELFADFGAENVERLFAEMEKSHVVAFDELCTAYNPSNDEREELMRVDPDVQGSLTEIEKIAWDIVTNHIAPTLPDFKKLVENPLYFDYQKITDQLNVPARFSSAICRKYDKTIAFNIHSLFIGMLTEHIYNAILFHIQKKITQDMKGNNEKTERALEQFRDFLIRTCRISPGFPTHLINVVGRLNRTRSAFEKYDGDVTNLLDKGVPGGELIDEDEMSALPQKIKKAAGEKLYRSVKINWGDKTVQVGTPSHELMRMHHINRICNFNIDMTEGEQRARPFAEKAGAGDVLELYFSRDRLELYITGTTIPLRHIMEPERYAQLRNELLKFTWLWLQKLDFEDLDTDTPRPTDVIHETKAEATTAITGDAEKIQDAVAHKVKESRNPNRREKGQVTMENILNRTPLEYITSFTTLCKPNVPRQNGTSHVIFTSPLTNGMFFIPKHKGTTLDANFVKKLLRKSGFSVQEVYDNFS